MPRYPALEFEVHRIYEVGHGPSGYRVLVERLWPRGINKEDAALEADRRPVHREHARYLHGDDLIGSVRPELVS